MFVRVHTHVERGVLVVRETPLGDIELRARDAQVKEEAVDSGNLGLDEQVVHVAKVAFEEPDLGLRCLGGKARLRCLEGHVVLVDP